METLDPRALGQILLVESLVAKLPSKVCMLEFTVRGLEGFPGVGKVWFQFPSGPDPPGDTQGHALPVSHNGLCHAHLCFALTDPVRFSGYLPYLKNLAFLLGVILDERWQRDENLRYRTQLEDLVEARTRSLAESEGRARAMLRTALDGVWLVDARGRLVEVNEAACAMLGYGHDEMVGMSIDRIEAGADPDRLSRFAGEASCLFETSHRRKDRSVFPVEVSGTFHAETGQAVVFVRNTTDRKRAEEDLRQALELRRQLEHQAEQAQRVDSLGRLAGGVAHDMNNVLGAILALATYNLDEFPTDSPVHGDFDTIAKAAVRGGQMVKRLLNLAHPAPVEDRAVDLNAVIRDVADLLERTTLARIHLELELEPGLRPLRGDASALAHAVMNLCVNAVDAMPGEGTLALRTRNLGEAELEIQVVDSGSGMAPEVARRALDPFFTTKDVGKGTGLGLSLVSSTVRAHHGRMALQTESGQGTRVILTFPACAPAQGSPAPAPAAPAEVPAPGLKLLLVDDDPLIQVSTQAILGRLGYLTTCSTSGEAALSALEAGYRPDVVILDLNMPGLGGIGVLPRLRALLPQVPVILATGKPDQTAHDLVAANRGVTLLAKPFSLEALRAQLGQLWTDPGPGPPPLHP